MFGIPLAIILGSLSGFGVNVVGALAGGGTKAIVLRAVVPLAVQLAQSVLGGTASRTTAEDLLKAAGHKVSPEVTADVKADPTAAPSRTTKKR
ncbi:hypothetical protein [Planctomicrobium sp. SH527]|uniref:hypothetical protein n=1 Tax=Planctomicrobium sp. SH527 TaxID=3448123 RepID=UPI003F5CB0CB